MEIAFKTQCGQAYPIGQVGGHDKVVLDNETGLLGVQNETFDNLKKRWSDYFYAHQRSLGQEILKITRWRVKFGNFELQKVLEERKILNWPWLPRDAAPNPGKPRVRRSGKRRRVYPNKGSWLHAATRRRTSFELPEKINQDSFRESWREIFRGWNI